jgi:hypothetical protein
MSNQHVVGFCYVWVRYKIHCHSVADTHWFNADPDPAFYLKADQDPANADLCGSGSWSVFAVTKSWIMK